MENLAEKIYEAYLKPREQNYFISDIETKLVKTQCEFENELTLNQRLKFEEIDFLAKKLNHEKNLDLIEFVINYLNKREDN